ncbi:MAG: 2-oxoacid:acceptor oxidoreductase family protein, partial [Candidatus Omnitrophica bacterium]|nr:2-oxoacid:acceptor oxidoreductase family protein [Candidatus Omnitrophota bacterium]
MSIRIGGPAGSGIQTIGYALAKAFLRGGQHVFAAQDYQSRIRGGHNYFQVRVSDKPLYASSAKIDILIALDLETIKVDTKDLKNDGIVLFDNEVLKEFPSEERLSGVPFERLAKEAGGNKLYMNSTAVGAAVGLIGFDFEIVSQVIRESFHDKEPAVQDGNIQAAKAGLDATTKSPRRLQNIKFDINKNTNRMLINGSDALALGALRAGVKFHSGYP